MMSVTGSASISSLEIISSEPVWPSTTSGVRLVETMTSPSAMASVASWKFCCTVTSMDTATFSRRSLA